MFAWFLAHSAGFRSKESSTILRWQAKRLALIEANSEDLADKSLG